MKYIVYTRPDGSVSVVVPAAAFLAGCQTEEDGMAAILAKDVPGDAVNVHLCDASALPASRRFRDCWRQTGAAPPLVHLPLARVQRMNEIRAARAPLLIKADNNIRIAEDAGDLARALDLRAYRQRLRDVPQTNQASLDACATPEALEAWNPAMGVDDGAGKPGHPAQAPVGVPP